MVGFFVGFVAGLLGIGGGVIIVPIVTLLFEGHGMDHALQVEILKELMQQLDDGRNIDAGVQYRGETFSLTLAWYGSFFTNGNPELSWETPFLATPDTSVLRMAQQPDNEFQQLSLSGKYLVDRWDTVIAFLAASGQGKQNEALLPYTSNPSLGGVLPPLEPRSCWRRASRLPCSSCRRSR